MPRRSACPTRSGCRSLTTLQVNNGAMVALDYQTGEVIAYVGSAGYYLSELTSPQFQPQFDVVGNGWRQPGSAFKPFNYVTGIDDRTMTAASMFMDVTTKFPGGQGQPVYIPTDADLLERGPLRLRQALNFSLNIPAVKALTINGIQHVFEKAQQFGFQFKNDQPSATLSLTLGTEGVHWKRPGDCLRHTGQPGSLRRQQEHPVGDRLVGQGAAAGRATSSRRARRR